jgi:serine/threonine protein kinase/tetratricopeptide (TPR) repeat protein
MLAPSITVGQLLGHYRIVEKIGRGGQGDVFRAHDERFDRDVALKILPIKALSDDAARQRFRQEAQAVGRLSHPNIATAYYFGEDNGIDFLVTEYISGARLDEKLANGPLPETDVLALGVELASGLEAAHREGIIHRDLKPGNLRVTEKGQLKILDFGLAELVDPKIDVTAAETVTLTMTLTGTLPYMAPEQFDGVFDQRTDLWAVGAVLYELATGQLPFHETQLQRLKNAIRHEEPKKPRALNSAISPGLESVILRALQKDPKRRYQTAGELRDDLARVAAGQKVKLDSRLSRRGLQLAVLLLLIGASAYLTHRFWPRPPVNRYRVLAVLPLATEGDNPADGALGRGVAQTVSARIAQGSNSRVFQLIPPNELSAKEVKTADAARREFGVDMVLAVGLQRSGDKMRITCSLIDPRTHQQVDARTVTGDAGDLFALEDNAVTEVFAMLPQNVKAEQPTAMEVQAAVPAGYEYYVRGKGYLLDYEKPENIDNAIKQFDQALKESPNYAPALAGLGQAYWTGYQRQHRAKSWLDKASEYCQLSLKASPQLPEGHTCLGDVYNSTGQYERALEQLQRASSLTPDDVPTLGELAEAYDKLGKTGEAEAAYKRAIELRPHYWAVYNWLGFFYYGHARYAEAADMFRKVTEVSPENARGYSNLGGMYLMEGKYNDAISALRRSAELQPSKDAFVNLGAAYYYLRDYPAAIDAFKSAQKFDERYFLAWGNLGDALYWSAGRRGESAVAYKKAVELARSDLAVNPEDAVLAANIAEYSAMLDDRQTADQYANRALQIDPKNPEVLFRSALVYNHFGDTAKTLAQLKKAVNAGFAVVTIRDTPDFDPLKNNAEFRNLTHAQ